MSQKASPSTGRRYSLATACAVLGVPRSTVYAQGAEQRSAPRKRGPKTAVADEQLLAAIGEVLAKNAFHGEGHKKVHARLRHGSWQMKVGKERVLRLMRANGLLAPVRRMNTHGRRAHDGKIVTDRPNDLWGADATTFWTEEDGLCWFFGVVDHFNSECVGLEVVKRGDRWAAIESVRSAARATGGACGPLCAQGVALRHDWGPQYTADAFRRELRFLGIAEEPAFVGEPETNGVAERFMRTLKEHCIYLHHFKSLEEARPIIADFVSRYNREWIIGRLGYRTPAQARADFLAQQTPRVA